MPGKAHVPQMPSAGPPEPTAPSADQHFPRGCVGVAFAGTLAAPPPPAAVRWPGESPRTRMRASLATVLWAHRPESHVGAEGADGTPGWAQRAPQGQRGGQPGSPPCVGDRPPGEARATCRHMTSVHVEQVRRPGGVGREPRPGGRPLQGLRAAHPRLSLVFKQIFQNHQKWTLHLEL